MIPVKIRMIDFLSYEDESFDFSKISAATVVGRNGAGKSSFCTDAITWALFGQGSKGGVNERANYVRRGAGSCSVEFSFSMNGNIYKVVRSYTVANKKTSLVMFGVTDIGDEIPMSTKASEAQAQICDMLKMDYSTFTASSIVLQNQIHAFTEGMGDTQKKEALLSVLNVGVWETYRKKNAERVKTLKSEMDVLSGKLAVAEESVAKEETLRAAMTEAKEDLAKAESVKAARKGEVDAFADRIVAVKSAEESVATAESLLKAKKEMLANTEAEVDKAKRRIDEAEQKKQEINASLQRLNKIVSHGDEIRDAAAKEPQLAESLAEMQAAMAEHATSVQRLSQLTDMGKRWNSDKEKKLRLLETSRAEKEQQANLVASVPCANTDIAPKCPLLSMAFAAKKALAELDKEIAEANAEVNPYRAEYAAELQNRNALAEKFSDEKIKEAESFLTNLRRYSSLLPALESASEQMASLQSILDSEDKAKKEAEITSFNSMQKIVSLQKEAEELAHTVEAKRKDLAAFDAVKEEYQKTLATLNDAETREKEARDALSRAEAEIGQVTNAKEQVKAIQKQLEEMASEKDALDVFGDACNKINGVPAFIVANAIPELENSANEVLGRMMDGRLQIKFRTSKTDNEDVVGSLFRIDVSEQSELDPREFSTFSGAEKFIIALAIRIAMSRFLAHRAGASVQLFVLDEGVSCADAENREEIIRALRSLSSDFAKVLFITHDDELKDALDSKITVTKDSTGSHLHLG